MLDVDTTGHLLSLLPTVIINPEDVPIGGGAELGGPLRSGPAGPPFGVNKLKT